MRKIALIAVLLIVWTFGAAEPARQKGGHAFEATVGAGYASLGYNVNDITPDIHTTTVGFYGLQAHIGYNWFFSKYLGVAVGVDAHHYGQKTTLSGTLVWKGVTDTDGERYEHRLRLDKWNEQQDCWTVEIPLSLVFAFPIPDKCSITAQIGGKFGLPLSATYNGYGTLIHTGYYEPWNLVLSDKPNHGFYTERDFKPKGQFRNKNYWTVFAKAGVTLPLAEHLDLLVQLYANYALTSLADEGQNEVLGFRNDRPGQEQNHYFMSNYTDLHNTPVITDRFKPWDIGLEIGIRYTISSHKHQYPCRCLGVR